MGATLLLQVAAAGDPEWPIRALVSTSGGGFIPFNEARRATMDYDCTLAGMRAIVSNFVHDQNLLDDERLVEARYRAAIKPGAWEAVAAARFRSPLASQRKEFGTEDQTEYEAIDVPTLLIAGADDKLREPGYADELAERIPVATLKTFDDCGHLPQIEHAELFNREVSKFLSELP
jgi:pimeloyl-ACP methyl ester carboxylesterase